MRTDQWKFLYQKYFKHKPHRYEGSKSEFRCHRWRKEDGVDNSGVENDKLYTQPEHVAQRLVKAFELEIYLPSQLLFCNVHGVYMLRVMLNPNQSFLKIPKIISRNVSRQLPINRLISYSMADRMFSWRYPWAISYGAIKMNIDTDMQWAFWEGVKGIMIKERDYLQAQL